MEVLRTILFCLGMSFMMSHGLAQITSAQEAYEQLDAFREHPSPENTTLFSETIRTWNPQTDEDRLAKVIASCNVGYYQQRFFQFQEAITSYEEAKGLYQEHGLEGYNMIEFCYKPLGNLYTKTNALAEAENVIREYILEAQGQGRKEEEASGLLNLSVVFQNKGNYRQAIQVLEQGRLLLPSDDRFLLNLATNHLSLDNLEAAKELLNILLKKDVVSPKTWQLWARIQLLENNPERALESLERSMELLQKKDRPDIREVVKLGLALAQTEWMMGDLEGTKEYLVFLYQLLLPNFPNALRLPEDSELFPDNTLIDALDLHAAVLEKENKGEGAYHAYLKAFQVVDLLNEVGGLQNSKLLQQNQNKTRSEKTLNVLFDLYESTSEEKWLKDAFRISEASKYPVLQEARRWQESIWDKDDPDYLELLKLKQTLAQNSVKMDQLRYAEFDHFSQVEQLQQEYNRALLKQGNLYAKLNEKYSDVEGEDDLSMEQLIRLCDEQDQTMVSYFFGKKRMYQFTVSSNGIEGSILAETESNVNVILQYIDEYIRYFENSNAIVNNPTGFVDSAHQLYAALKLPDEERLVVIPDGVLSFVPFASLVIEPSQTQEFTEIPFLITRAEVRYALSAKDYMTNKNTEQEQKVLGVFPVFSGTDKALRYSVEEAEGLRKYTNASVLLHDDANSAAFLEQSRNHSILHISTHAKGGTFSSAAAIEFADRTVTLDELYGYEFDKDLVVLSACETGVGKVIRGEGVQHMARAFQYTGTDNVLFSLWKVNDYSTARIMQDFYKEYGSSRLKGASLHESQLSYIMESNLDNTKKSPYYWAAFVYYGTVETPSNGLGYLLWYLLAALAIAISLYTSQKYRKRKSRGRK